MHRIHPIANHRIRRRRPLPRPQILQPGLHHETTRSDAPDSPASRKIPHRIAPSRIRTPAQLIDRMGKLRISRPCDTWYSTVISNRPLTRIVLRRTGEPPPAPAPASCKHVRRMVRDRALQNVEPPHQRQRSPAIPIARRQQRCTRRPVLRHKPPRQSIPAPSRPGTSSDTSPAPAPAPTPAPPAARSHSAATSCSSMQTPTPAASESPPTAYAPAASPAKVIALDRSVDAARIVSAVKRLRILRQLRRRQHRAHA